MSKKGVVLFSHGSKREQSNRAFRELVEEIEIEGVAEIGHAFLEFTEPGLVDAVEEMISEGADKMVIVPVFLFPGKHVRDDLPGLVEELEEENEEVEFVITDLLSSHPRFKGLIEERIMEGLEKFR